MHNPTRLTASTSTQLQSLIALLDNLAPSQANPDNLISPNLQALVLRQLREALEACPDDAGIRHHAVRSLGYLRLNAEEKTLVENLRWTRHKGRDKVYRLAEQMRLQKPWQPTA